MSASTRPTALKPGLLHAGTLVFAVWRNSEALFLTRAGQFTAEDCESASPARSGLRLFALLQSDHEHVEQHGRPRRGGSRAIDGNRNGRRHHGAHGPGQSGRSRGRRKALFGSCRWVIEEWLPRFGVTSTLVNGTDLNAWKKASRKYQSVLLNHRPIRHWKPLRTWRLRISPTLPAPGLLSTMFLRRRLSKPAYTRR